MNRTLSIAKEYSETPASRYRHEGPDSGERFRDDYLIPALTEFDGVTVELEGVVGFGSSFLEESFGGLIRSGYREKELKERLKVVGLPIHIERIWRYIGDAEKIARKR